MKYHWILGAVAPLVFAAAPVLAQEAPGGTAPELAGAAPVATLATPEVVAPAACCTALASSIVQLEIVDSLSTKTLKRGDKFAIRLAEPLIVDGKVLVPAGVVGQGEVVHAARPSIGGKPGELLLAARYLDYGDTRIPLKAMKLGRAGTDNANMAMAASFVTPLAIFITGGEVLIPTGTRANAKLSAELVLPALPPAPRPEPVATPATETSAPAAPEAAAAQPSTQESN